MKRLTIGITFAVLVLPFLPLVSLLLVGQPGQPAALLRVHILDVGQADAIYLECPDPGHHNMLIDSGDVIAMRYPGSPKLFQEAFAELMGDRKQIDVVISSHPHSDHAGSLAWILDNFDVKTFIDDGMKYESKTYQNVMQRADKLAGQGKLKYLHATNLPNGSKAADFCPVPGVTVALVKPQQFGDDKNPNNNSTVVRVAYNGQAFLFTGDAEEEEEQQLLADPATRLLLPATVLKAPHHGSDTSSSPEFLAVVKPQIIVVSAGEKEVGTNKGYRHPRAETIARFLEFTKPNGKADLRTVDAFDTKKNRWSEVQINAGLYVTSVDGSITLLTDGQKTWKADAGSVESPEAVSVRYVYSKNSNIYHFEECADAKNIKPENRITSRNPPPGKILHRGCPR
jgi:beta-lactamase superfamily II metal-dependent hydrolase